MPSLRCPATASPTSGSPRESPVLGPAPRQASAVVGRIGSDPSVCVMSAGADALYQYFDPLHYTLLATLRTLYAQLCWRDGLSLPAVVGAVVDLEVADDELAARLHCSLNTLRARRRAIHQTRTPVAVIIHRVEPVTEPYGFLNAVRCWRWTFCYIDPELTPAIIERAAILARQPRHGPGTRSRRVQACVTVEDRRLELKRQRQAKRISNHTARHGRQQTSGPTADDHLVRAARQRAVPSAGGEGIVPLDAPSGSRRQVPPRIAPNLPGRTTALGVPELEARRARDRSGPGALRREAAAEGPSGTPDVPRIGAPGVPEIGAPAAPRCGAPGAPKLGAPGAPECGAPGVPAVGAPGAPALGTPLSPVTAKDMYTTCCQIKTDVQKHVVHAWRAREEAGHAAIRDPDGGASAAASYYQFRHPLLASASATTVDLGAFEDFLHREVTGRIGPTNDLTWSQYCAFFRYWLQLGDAQAGGIAGEIRERLRTGHVRSPQAYLMWALKRRATHTEGASAPSARPPMSAELYGKIQRREREHV